MNLMNSATWISLFSAILNVSIGIYIFLFFPKKNTNRLFFLFVLSIVIFNIGEFFTRMSITKEEALFWGRITYSVLTIGACFFLHFSLVFPRKIVLKGYNVFSRYFLSCVYILGSIVYIFFIYFTSIRDVQQTEWGYRLVLTGQTIFVVIWFLILSGLTIYTIFYKYFFMDIDDIEKKQIRLVFIGASLILVIAIVTNILPPLFHFTLFPMASVSTSLFIIFIAYALIKYKFLSFPATIIAENILDTMSDLVIVIDRKGNIININKSALNHLGYNKDEMLNFPLKKIVKTPAFKKDAKTVKPSVFSILSIDNNDNRLKDFEVDFITKQGKYIPMNISTSSISDINKNLEGVVIVARDLTVTKKLINDLQEVKNKLEERVKERTMELVNTNKELQIGIKERKRAEEKLRRSQTKIEQQNIQLKKADRIKTDFLNVTSHELRTPMSSIKGYTQMISEQILGQINDEQKKALDVILRNTNRLDALIQDILDVSRLESGTMKFEVVQTDVKNMILETVETIKPFANIKNIEITTKFKDNLPTLNIDKERIKQVLTNILNNAIKFSTDGSAINIFTTNEEESILFEIQDFGRGIPRNELKKVFNIFYQVDSGEDRKYGGVGLGLAISRGIVLTHGGKMWVKSKMNEGSTFSFTVPIKPVQDIETRFKELNMFGLEKMETV